MTSKPLPDSDWSQRHAPISLRRLMHLNTLDSNTFISTSSAFPPTPLPRTYGGHVFAQAVYAASRTVSPGQVVHNATGWFAMLGDCRYAFVYKVKRTRDGGVYALRQVEAFQDLDGKEGKTPMFVATVSFKRDESGFGREEKKGGGDGKGKGRGVKGRRRVFEHQFRKRDWLETEYGDVLRQRRIEEWPLCQGKDGLWDEGLGVKAWLQRGDAFPGLEMRKVDLNGFNGALEEGAEADGGESARRYRNLVFYRIIDDEEGDEADDRNLDAIAHMYASDRNSLFLAQRALGYGGVHSQLGSLGHTVVFHGHDRYLKTKDENGKRKWFLQEALTSNSGADRVCHESRLWDYREGKIIATTIQDGQMRVPVENEQRMIDGEAVLRKESKL